MDILYASCYGNVRSLIETSQSSVSHHTSTFPDGPRLSDMATTVASFFLVLLHTPPPHSSPDIPRHATGHSVPTICPRHYARHPSKLERWKRNVSSVRSYGTILARLRYQHTLGFQRPASFFRIRTLLYTLHPHVRLMLRPRAQQNPI